MAAPVLGVRRVALVVPDGVDQRPVDRRDPQAVRRLPRRTLLVGGELDADGAHALLHQGASSSGSQAHSGSQSPPPHRPVRRRCEFAPVPTCNRIPASVASSGSTACVAELVQVDVAARGASRSPPRASMRAIAASYSPPRVVTRGELGTEAAGGEAGLVLRMARAASLVEERPAARTSGGRLELITDDGRERDGERRTLGDERRDRQVTARVHLPQPLLAVRPGAVPVDVRHVGVEDDRERSPRVLPPPVTCAGPR